MRDQISEIENPDVVDLKHYFSLVRRKLWLITLGLFLGAGAAFLISRYQTPIYEASTQVMVTRSTSSNSVTDVTQTLNIQQLSQTYVELLSQEWVHNTVAERIGGDIDADQITISAATNTQIIDITVEDPDPVRAGFIADTLVKVLIEQNDSIQSGRYSSAETSLDLQIQDIEQRIADLQVQLEITKKNTVNEQIAESQNNIASTQATINDIEAEIVKLEELWLASRARFQLANAEEKRKSLQTLLEQQLEEYQTLEQQMPTEPSAEQNETTIDIQTQIAELGVEINRTRQDLEVIQQEIEWLIPLTEENGIEKAQIEQENLLAVQQALLESYKQILTNLLATGQVVEVTDDISSLNENLSLYQEIYLNLVNNRETIRLERMQNMPDVVQLTPSIPSDKPIRPRIILNSVLGGLAGLALTIALIFSRDFLDTTLKTREDIERTLNLPVLGYVLQLDAKEKDKDGPYVLHAPRSPVSEAFRSLRTNLEYIGVDQPLKSILISSSGTAEGKTTVAANLAAVIAQSNKRVVLVDADLRRPRLHREMGLTNSLGLSDVFRERVALHDIYQLWPDLPLSVVTSGGIPPNPAELLGSEKMRKILDELEAEFDFVVVDSTPTIVTDSQLIAARVDGVLLVLWPGRTHAETARAAIEGYRRVGARLLGVIMNNVQPGQSYGGYTPYSNYQYYQYAVRENGLRLPWQRAKSGKNQEEISE